MLPLPVLAASVCRRPTPRDRPPQGGAELVTVISVLTLLSLLNNMLLMAPRVLYGIGRDGLLTDEAALVSDGGAPRGALACPRACRRRVILSGSFEQIIALFAVLFLVLYVSAFLRRVRASTSRTHAAPALQGLRLSLHHGDRPRRVGRLPVLAAIAEDPRRPDRGGIHGGLHAGVRVDGSPPPPATRDRRCLEVLLSLYGLHAAAAKVCNS